LRVEDRSLKVYSLRGLEAQGKVWGSWEKVKGWGLGVKGWGSGVRVEGLGGRV
jgi:hypothetical protein